MWFNKIIKMNYFDKKLVTLLASPFIAGVVLVSSASLVEFKPELRQAESELFRFSPVSANIVFKKEPVIVTGFLKSPVGINNKKAVKNLKPKPLHVPETGDKKVIAKKLTFILTNEFRKMAIINDFVLNEGDTVADSRVLMIERDRVLINEEDAGERWLKIGK